MKNLLVLFGGQSSENEVSCKSVASVLRNIDRTVFNVFVVGITKQGEWFLTEASPNEIENGEWKKHNSNRIAFISPNRKLLPLQIIEDGKIKGIAIDCIHPVMHGELCEDGAIQGLFELCGIPYVGPNVCSSACCMDKGYTKLVAATSGVRQAEYALVTSLEFYENADKTIKHIEDTIKSGYPYFVKPACAGSSIGVSKAKNREELIEAVEKASKVCRKILIEETILGREVEVAVLGNKDVKASVVGEVLAANEFYDYDAKYENNESKTVIPANISEKDSDKLRIAAVNVFTAMGCEGISRVDFFLLPNGQVVFNEINTLPGFTNISMYPKLWEASGISYKNLMTALYNLAIERGNLMS